MRSLTIYRCGGGLVTLCAPCWESSDEDMEFVVTTPIGRCVECGVSA